ncbi:carboxypeptidase-like regulatory domain-containing protein [Mongoliitalea daihaiensis]|uniref:carboxypeptidase-like regulatory domain-containing protein n=1 Tax=Mongoliitalea daihaiensis TaxID=2782006 RepID=UPI001F2F4C40|nr:carboxypeptidase regulatory-like domain-containing protein [Mongoliitalea daihaiensis]UJP65835.1 carboxypeptidase regulatory-like domain-containing protein [Mongoliitalea daihaiensis]
MKRITIYLFALAFFSIVSNTNAQNLMGGILYNQSNEPIPNAEIEITHSPSGLIYYLVTKTDGSYQLRNVETPGPYSIKVTLENSVWVGNIRRRLNQSSYPIKLAMEEGEGVEERHTSVSMSVRILLNTSK